jgi:hypothetical protein
VATAASTPVRDQATDQRQYLRSITVYIPRSLHQRLRTAATNQATTATALILAAINRTHGQLAQALIPAKETDGHALFDIPQVRRDSEPTMQTTIRITDRQLDAIVDLTNTHGVNRSRLIATALRLYLT